MIKNPNWQEAASWLFTKCGRVESGTIGNKSKPEAGMGFEPRATACKPNTLATGPRGLPKRKHFNFNFSKAFDNFLKALECLEIWLEPQSLKFLRIRDWALRDCQLIVPLSGTDNSVPLLNCFHRYLADLMDNPELIRNVALAGHLHTGKVQ